VLRDGRITHGYHPWYGGFSINRKLAGNPSKHPKNQKPPKNRPPEKSKSGNRTPNPLMYTPCIHPQIANRKERKENYP